MSAQLNEVLPKDIDPKGQALVTQASSFISQAQARAQSLLIDTATNADYETSANDLALIKGRFNEIDSHREFLKAPHLEGCKRVDGYFQPVLKTLKAAEEFVKQKQVAYRQRIEDQRREAQRLADEAAAKERKRLADEAAAALKKAAEEAAAIRAKAEAEAAAIRAKAEAEAKAAKNKADAEAARKRAEEEAERAIQKANEKADAKVEKAEAKADVLEQQAAVVSAVTVEDNRPQVKGQSTRKVWKGRVVNQKVVADHFKEISQKLIDDFAEATKGRVPSEGIEFYQVDILSSKSR